MTTKTFNNFIGIGIFVFLAFSLGCERKLDELEPASFPVDGNVFLDGFSAGLEYAAFGGSDVTAFKVVDEGAYEGTSVMRFSVPDFDDPKGAYAGGAFFVPGGRDLSGFNVLTFWARASQAATIDVLGFGNDLGANRYVTTISNTPVNTNWRKYYIPIPDPSRLKEEGGMFFYSEGPENGSGYTFWIDEVRFEKLGTIAHGEAGIFDGQALNVFAETGAIFTANGFAEFNLPTGVNQRVEAAPAYFTYTSSNPQVASVSPSGTVTVMDAGEATITAKLGDLDAVGSLKITSTGAAVLPASPAPVPTVPASDVISIYSNAYTNVPIDFLNGYWQFSTTQSEEVQVQGDDIVRYSQLNFVGIQFTAPTIDIRDMTHFHLDIWTPDATDPPAAFKVLLVDIGADGDFGGNDNSSHEITITSPRLQSQTWVSLDLPLTDFPGLTGRQHLAQIVLSGDLPNVFVDNIYFYDDGQGGGGGGSTPTVAAPNPPTRAAADVISVFSNAYTNVAGTDLNPDWGQATAVSQVSIAGNNTLLYSGLNYQGIQLGTSQNVSSLESLHLDFWTANSTQLNVYLISTGPQEKAYALNVPTSGWSSVDIPLSEFSGVDLADVIQLKFDGNGTIYLDNIYFFRGSGGGGGGSIPTVAAPTPTLPAADVISLFSDAYTNVTVDTWRTDWSAANFADITVAGNATKEYTNLDFVGIETVVNQINATSMTHFHIDVWTPNATFFAIKLVDFGADAAFGGGDDKEHQIDYPTPTQGQWISYDIPLTDFVGLTTRAHMAQYILVGQPIGNSTIYVDNMYFHK
ncbi:MAG: Ig-like domain-containing protein [Bacteroidia bacterium]